MTVLAGRGPSLSYARKLRKIGRRTKLGPCADGLFGGLLFEGFESALQAHAARALEQDDVALAEVLLEPHAGLAGTLDELRRDSLGTRSFDDLRREAAHTDDTVEAGHLFTRGAVQRGALGTEFEHLARDDE